MSDFGLFESDEAAQAEPRLAAKTAAVKLEAAIDAVRKDFGRFLLGATGIDEFGDRWHYSKNDIRKAIEPYVFPNTGTMRRVMNAMKADWKLAHPYKLAEDRDAPIQDIDETFHPSGGNLIPEGDFEGYKNSVDQNGPEKVDANDFTPGGDSGRHEAARLVADIYTDFARSNGLRVASLDTLDLYASTGIHEADYRLLQSMIVRTAEDCECEDDEEEAPEASESDDEGESGESDEAPDFGGEDESEGEEEESDDSDDYEDSEDSEGEGGETYTIPEEAPELDPELQQQIPQDDPGGSAPIPPEVIDSILGLPEGTIEQLVLEEVERGAGGGEEGVFGGPPPEQGGGDPSFGGDGPRLARRRRQANDNYINRADLEEYLGRTMPYEDLEQVNLPGLADRYLQRYPHVIGERPDRFDHDDNGPRYPGPNWKDQWLDANGPSGDEYSQMLQEHFDQRNAARRFWAAEGDQEQESEGGGEQAAPAQDPTAMGGMDPSMMGGGQMMPPPGSQAVQPPAPPQPVEDQPAEDALLDTANQAIMQMIDRETQEYQQIIDPLSQALQAIQFAQQVEQAEHPMDVTPPQGTVDVSPSAAPGGQPPMQQQAMRRQAIIELGPPLRGEEGARAKALMDRDRENLESIRNGKNPYLHPGYDYDNERWKTREELGYGREAARQAKVDTALRNAAALIARKYRLSATGHQMLVEATLGRRGYEHVVEALRLVPPDSRKAAAIHMSHLFAAGNQRFNKDIFMKTVMASNPRDRAGDAWRDGRDRGIAEHGRHDMEDIGYLDLHPSSSGPRTLQDRLSEGADFDWVDGGDGDEYAGPHYREFDGYEASKGRSPKKARGAEAPRRLAGETWTNTPTKDAFEFPQAGQVPRVDDNLDINDLPTMKGADPHGKNAATSYKAVDRFQRWQKRQQEMGLPNTEGESAVHNFLQTKNPAKKRVGPDAANSIHRELGLQPDSIKTPKSRVPKAVNPALPKGSGSTPKAPKPKPSTPKGAPKKTGSFFTRKVPGWRWDDHLNGYLSKEARAFTCSCGEKIAAPSYTNCKCGSVWNIYAVGDTHHLASDTADMFIAREIPVRPGVVMANKKMAGEATKSHRELLAEIERLADWTKYDGPDPSRDPKAKPPSTTIPKQPKDWTNREFTGPDKGQWREPDPTELPRKTRKKK